MKVFLISLCFAGVPAFASTNQLDFYWGRGSPLGAIKAQDSSEQDGLRGNFWFLDGLHHVSNRLYVGMGFGHFRSSDNNSNTFVPNINSTISSGKTSTLLLGRFDISSDAHFVPYAMAGLGWVKNSLTVSSDQGTLVDDSKSTVGYTGGLGMDVILGDRLLIGIEARYEGSPTQHFGMTPTGQAETGLTDIRTPINLFLVGLKAGVKY